MSEPLGSGRVLAPSPVGQVEPLASPPSFSVVIPAYQAAESIAAAVGSVLEQVRTASQVIVVDDGSTDGTVDALRPFRGEIELIRKANGGAASARNAGARAAHGDYVAVLDADDSFHPRRIEALADLAMRRPDLDLITTDARFVIEGREAGSFLRDNPFATEDQRAAILRSCFVGGWPAVRRDRLLEIGGYDEGLRIGHDWDCWLRMILAGSSAGLVDRPYYDYTLHGSGLTASRTAALWDRVKLLEKAAENPALRPRERPTLKYELRRRRNEAVEEETLAALRSGGSRARLLALAFRPGISLRLRVAGVLAAPVPQLAGRLIRHGPTPEERLAEGEP
ncbi:MAG TPA: glycosyltransferase family A protein [Solirubrobacterales bacterium]|nr:glycosyltransferase family A protein [Solirubrobacterales bacterium]